MNYLPLITVKTGDSRRIVDLIDRINIKTQCQEVNPKLQAQYDYVKNLVETLREERRQKLITEPHELSSQRSCSALDVRSVEDLIEKHYGEGQLRASTITKSMRATTGKRYTRTNLEDDLKDSTRYRIKTSHNVAYVVHVEGN